MTNGCAVAGKIKPLTTQRPTRHLPNNKNRANRFFSTAAIRPRYAGDGKARFCARARKRTLHHRLCHLQADGTMAFD
jgi:hypothetical protein